MSQELNSIIDELAKIDSASAKIMRKTQDEKAKYAEYITQQKKDFDKKLEEQVDAEIADYEKSLAVDSKREIEQCQTKCNEDIALLESTYREKSDSLSEEIFKNIIKE